MARILMCSTRFTLLAGSATAASLAESSPILAAGSGQDSESGPHG